VTVDSFAVSVSVSVCSATVMDFVLVSVIVSVCVWINTAGPALIAMVSTGAVRVTVMRSVEAVLITVDAATVPETETVMVRTLVEASRVVVTGARGYLWEQNDWAADMLETCNASSPIEQPQFTAELSEAAEVVGMRHSKRSQSNTRPERAIAWEDF
jgi:hypothetical protein